MSVASKNLYDLLGNDDDGTDAPSAPVKTVDKTSTHTAKRNTDGQGPSKTPVAGGNRRGGAFTGSEGAFRDRNAGSDRNRSKPTDEAPRGGARGGRDARGRGGRGGRFPRDKDDRHTKGVASNADKQAAQGWGATEGEAELKDEQAAEAIAQSDAKDAEAEAIAEEPEEPEEKHMTLDAYLAQQAEKRLALGGGSLNIRQANEGTKENKKWANAQALSKEEENTDFIAASGGKSKRERERKVKQVVDIDQTWVEPDRNAGIRGGRGGRGGPRGDRGGPRGDFRGGRGGSRGDRGGAPRGDRGDRGGPRGGRGNGPRGGASNLNTSDEKAFPSLGA